MARGRPRIFGWLTGFLAICLAIVGLGFAASQLHDVFAQAGFFADRSDDPTPVSIEIAGRELHVPAKLIRFARQRNGGSLDQLDLAVLWPSLEGYSGARKADFDNVTASSPVIDLTIRPRQTTTDTAGRLATIYHHFFGSEASDAPDGLVGYTLTPDSGLADEIVYFESGSTRPYAVHCQTGVVTAVGGARPSATAPSNAGEIAPPPLCLREIHAGDDALSVQIRYHRPLLKDWKAMDAALRHLLAAIGLAS